MGSSGECRAKPIDVPAGGLVWVRRRNGQWWPGQILGPEELPETSSVSGRSGTPVKLLGLKDSCIDWHNLENSKRVRAFRCGEYDKCIEKALLVAASGSRKAVKYNRREDAILHALEIERSFLGKPNPNPSFSLGLELDKQNGGQNLIGELPREGSENVNGEYSSPEDNSSSKPKLSHSSVSFEGTNCKEKTPNDLEDDGIEGAQRMKGLDDLGMMGVVQSVKRKRSQVVRINEKKKSRCCPLTKALQSKAMLSVPIMCEEVPSPIGAALDKAPDGKAMVINNKSNSAGALCENGTSSNASGDSCGKCKRENEISETLDFAGAYSTKGPTADLPIPRRSLPYRLSRFVVNPKYESPDFSLRHHVADSSLTDVKVEVKSNRTRHIPYISLTSKLNGQPITGHRLAVEVLDDGFCDQLLVSSYSNCHDLGDDSAPKRVDMVNKTKLSFGGRVPAKHTRLQPPASPTKPSKSKKEGMLSKKVRKLSSLTGPRKHNREKNPTVQQLRGPAIACVPLKVVFSRIKAALNSSIRPAHRLNAPSIG